MKNSPILNILIIVLMFTMVNCKGDESDDTGIISALLGLDGNTCSTTITADGAGVDGTITAGNTACYTFTNSESTNDDFLIGVYSIQSSLNPKYEVYDSTNSLVYSRDINSITQMEGMAFSFAPGTYKINVTGVSGTYGSYKISVANGPVSGGGSCNTAIDQCQEYNTSYNLTDCGTATLSTSTCDVVRGVSPVGRCTTLNSIAGIYTNNTYSPTYTDSSVASTGCESTHGTGRYLFD